MKIIEHEKRALHLIFEPGCYDKTKKAHDDERNILKNFKLIDAICGRGGD